MILLSRALDRSDNFLGHYRPKTLFVIIFLSGSCNHFNPDCFKFTTLCRRMEFLQQKNRFAEQSGLVWLHFFVLLLH